MKPTDDRTASDDQPLRVYGEAEELHEQLGQLVRETADEGPDEEYWAGRNHAVRESARVAA